MTNTEENIVHYTAVLKNRMAELTNDSEVDELNAKIMIVCIEKLVKYKKMAAAEAKRKAKLESIDGDEMMALFLSCAAS